MIEFDYILRGYEVDEYCYIIIDKYGEDSDVVRCLDKSYEYLIASSPIYMEQLNVIRKFLYDNQYKDEVEYADSVFVPRLEKRLLEVSKYSGLTDLEMRQKTKQKYESI